MFDPSSTVDNALQALQIGLSIAPVPGLGVIAIALQQTIKYGRAMKICEAQCAALSEQAINMYEVTSQRYRYIMDQQANKDELTVLDKYIVRLQVEVDSINEDLDKLVKKPKYHLFVHSSRISGMIDSHRDKLNNYANMISMAAAVNHQSAAELVQQHFQRHSAAMELDHQSIRVIQQNTDTLRQQLEECQRTLASYQPYSRTGPRKEQADEARLLLYSTRHNLSASDLVLPIATMDGEIERLGNNPIHAGSTHDIWKGLWLKEYDVALKVYRGISGALTDHEQMRLNRQIDLWRTMKHPNVLSLLGVCTLDKGPAPDSPLHFVSPWLPNSDAPAYLRKNPDVDRMRIIHDMALGLKYLHSIDIMHGGLQGSNVLISGNGSAVLSDFRMSKFFDGQTMFTQSNGPQSSLRWMPPEAHNLEEMTPPCDIYSFAMTALQLLSDQVPYYKTKAMGKLVVMITTGSKKPAREDYPSRWIDDRMWYLLNKCWQTDPQMRINIDEVLYEVEAIRREQYGWDGRIIIQEGWSSGGVILP